MESARNYYLFDVDNTVCHSCQKISKKMTSLMERVAREGKNLSFISGTNVENLSGMISSELECPHYLLGNTGTHAVYVDSMGKYDLYDEKMSEEEKKEIVEVIDSLVKKYGLKPMTSSSDQIQDRGSQITLSVLGRNAPRAIKEKYDPDAKKRVEMVSFIRKKVGDKYEYNIGGTTSIDITRKGIDKAHGLRLFQKKIGFSLREVLFFGDKLFPGGNDFPMVGVVDCVEVSSPEDTLKKLEALI